MGIHINLNVMMAKRNIGLSELAEKVDITNANLSILKTTRPKLYAFPPSKRFAKHSPASREI